MPTQRICKVEGCDRAHYAKDLCQKHYNATLPRKVYEGKQCSVDGCVNKVNGQGLCTAHQRQRDAGKPLGPLQPRRRVVDGHKQCADCEQFLPLDAFHKSRTGFYFRCKACNSIMNRAYRYKITREEVIELLARPCDVCGSEEPAKGKGGHHVDHCHDTGKVRGVLCHRCNVALGYAKNDPEVLRGLIAYIERSRT
jgi:hypothetical protein